MKRKATIGLAVVGAFLALTIVPVLVTQLKGSEAGRKLHGVRLADTDSREIRFRNHEAGIELAGLLFVPEGDGPFPAVVIVHGSGSSRRDNRWYLTLTHYLQGNGIVVLLPDKRGSEQSQGDWRTASFEDLAADTLAAISWLKDGSQLPLSAVGIVGMSQGGHIAPLAARRSADIAFLVNVVGASLPMHETLLYEEDHNLRQMGFLPGISRLVAHASTAWLRNVAQRDFWRAIGNFDPLPFWQALTIPALVLYGLEDTNLPSIRSAARLRALDKPNIEVVVYEGSGHALESPEGHGDSLFREDALERIRDFIRVRARGRTVSPRAREQSQACAALHISRLLFPPA